jgi:hypothetical protein
VPVEILIETDLVADFDGVEIDPDIMNVRFDFRQEIAVDAVIERHRFTVAQVGVGFIGQILAFFIGWIIAEIRQIIGGAAQMMQQLVKFIAAEFKSLRDNFFGGFVMPADGVKDGVFVAGTRFDGLGLECVIHLYFELIEIAELGFADRGHQRMGCLRQISLS